MQHIISGVKALYPRLNSTYRFDTEEYRSVKCDPTSEGAAYELAFNLTSEQCKELNTICMQAYKNAAALETSKRKWPEQPLSLPYKRDDDNQGHWIGKAKLKGAYSGDVTNPPRQVDASRKKLPDGFELTSGSTVNIAVTVVPFNASQQLNGVSLRLRAVQVLELAEKQESEDPFTEVAGGYSGGAAQINGVEQDPFGLPPAQPAQSNDLEDEIPF